MMEKKAITIQDVKKDWMRHFPLLKPYPRNKLFMKLDIMLIGIDFQTGHYGKWYRPNLCIQQLWIDSERNISGPYFWYLVSLRILNNLKNATIYSRMVDIDYDRCDAMSVDEAVGLAKMQFGSLLDENVYVDAIFKFIDYTDKIEDIYNPPFCRGNIELMIVLAKYFEDDDLTEYVRKKVHIMIKRFRERRIQELYNMSKQDWEQSLFDSVGNREQIMHCVEINSQNEKIQNLKKAHLIFDKSRFDFSDVDQSLFTMAKEALRKFWRGRDRRLPWYIAVFK